MWLQSVCLELDAILLYRGDTGKPSEHTAMEKACRSGRYADFEEAFLDNAQIHQ